MRPIKPNIRLTIGTKLVGIIAMLLMVSVASIVFLSTRMFIEDNTALIQQTNADAAASLSTQMRELFEGITEKMRVMGTVLLQGQSQDVKDRVTQEFFRKDKDLLAVFVHTVTQGQFQLATKGVSPEIESLNDSGAVKTLNLVQQEKDFALAQVAKGDVLVFTAKLPDGSPAVILSIPFIASATNAAEFTHTLTSVMRQTRFVKAFSESDIVTSFMVDHKGKLLAHPDAARVGAGENVSHLAVVKQLLEGKFNNGQTRYADSQTGEKRLGAFRVVGFGGLGVVAEVAEAKAFEAAKRVEYRAMMLAFVILCLSFMAGYLFSGTITWPIKLLVQAAGKISAGDFKINLTPKGQDEIAHLSLAFNEMAQGLEERDRVKETFNKFHNKEIAEKLLSGEVKLGGERKVATIFFSDVRGFTAMSESMEPEQVVEMLNEYMTCMVGIIRNYGGVVDKYVGDAIMALWGVPIAGQDDTYRAVLASLAMREELAKLNELRISRGQNALKIGMGVNTGQVIAGNIGSNEKMEYTVIGDSVNLASRIESMTKEYGTDLLISKGVYEQVKDRFVIEACKTAKVKGKTNAIEIFKVRGFINENGEQILIETPYSSYEAEKSDKVVHEKPAAEPTPEVNIISEPTAVMVGSEINSAGATEWYFFVEEQVFGPFTTEEVYAGLQSRELTPNMPCNNQPNGPWITLSDRPEFQGIFSSAA